jgi:hypothetical protein
MNKYDGVVIKKSTKVFVESLQFILDELKSDVTY